METKDCIWVVIDGECYVPCLNSITHDVAKDNVYGFDYCPYCGKDFDLKTDDVSIKKAMHKMKIEYDKEVTEDKVKAEIKKRQNTQVKLFNQLISKNKKA